jgi:hypothetical protein
MVESTQKQTEEREVLARSWPHGSLKAAMAALERECVATNAAQNEVE